MAAITAIDWTDANPITHRCTKDRARMRQLLRRDHLQPLRRPRRAHLRAALTMPGMPPIPAAGWV